MGLGGKRPGAGRPKGSKAKRHKVVIDEALLSGLMPIEWMLAVLRDPEAEQSRRDDMAKAAANYLHPRLAAVEVNRRGKPADVNLDVVQVLAVPRGCRIVDGVVIDGTSELEPYTPTPAITDQTVASDTLPPEPLSVIEVETDNVESLNRWRKRDE
jgi:hypothetical protein